MDNKEPKQVIVLRTDLNMRKGKMIAQGAHASLKVFLDRASYDKFDGCFYWQSKDEAERIWLESKFTKIVVGVDSEAALLTIHEQAKEAGILVSLIQDAGRTEFDGMPTFTAVAVGPDLPSKIDPITGSLKLL